MGTDELKAELKLINLLPSQVFDLNVKKQKWNEDALYLLHFKREDNITLPLLKKIRAVLHTIVTWKPYKSNKKGPTQCRNCLMYGHGSSFCRMQPNCMFCAERHQSMSCTNKENSNFNNKCFNCNGNHKSNDQSCPSRTSYINIRHSINHRNISNNLRGQPKQNDGNRNPPRNVIITTAEPGPPSRPVTENFSYADAVRPNSSNNSDSSGFTGGNENVNNNNKNGLFSPKELMNIFSEITNRMRNCNTKEDQLGLLFDIASKYVR